MSLIIMASNTIYMSQENEYDGLIQKAPAGNEYDKMLIEMDEENQQNGRHNLIGALGKQPDTVAKADQLSKKTGIPAEVVERNMDDVERRSTLNDYNEILSRSPGLSSSMQDQHFADLASDDIPALGKLEGRISEMRAIQGPKPGFFSVTEGLAKSLPIGLELARQGMYLQWADLIGSDNLRKESLQKIERAEVQRLITTPRFKSGTASGVYGGASSFIRQAPGLAVSIATRNPVPSLASMGIQTEAEAYGKYRARGANEYEALMGAMGEGATEVITEIMPMSFLVKKFGKIGFGEFLTGLLAREIPNEQVATLVQDAIDTAIANPDKTWGDYFEERPDAAYQTLISTITQAGITSSLHIAAKKVIGDGGRSIEAEESIEQLDGIIETNEETELRKRDPEAYKAFVKEAIGEDAEPFYIDSSDARKFFQSHPEAFDIIGQNMPETAQDILDAFDNGGSIAIPQEEYLTYLSEYHQALRNDIRIGADRMTASEAQEWQTNQSDQFAAEAEQIMRERAGDSVHQDSANRVFEQVKQGIAGTGRFNEDTAGQYAALHQAFAVTTAEKLGILPHEVYEKYGLRFQGEGVTDVDGGKSLFQSEPDKAETFYSGLERATDNLKQEKGSAQQLLAQIKKTAGVKKEEIEWLGLDEYLAGKEKVTKQEILDFVRQGGVQVDEVKKGGRNYESLKTLEKQRRDFIQNYTLKAEAEGFDHNGAENALYALINDPYNENAWGILNSHDFNKNDPQFDPNFMHDIHDEIEGARRDAEIDHETGGDTKFNTYQLPGGENYRELLLTLPETETTSDEHHVEAVDVTRPGQPEEIKYNVVDSAGNTVLHHRSTREEADDSARRLNTTADATYKSGHYDEPNILAHVRFNERTDSEGNRVLFVEEVQSDWHQRGRQDGYGKTSDIVRHHVYKEDEFNISQSDTQWITEDFHGKQRAVGKGTVAGEAEAREYFAKWLTDIDAERASGINIRNENKVPDAPFKTSWPLLTMKRMIRHAAENGFDRIAWTTGEQQAERYDLSKQVDSIEVRPMPFKQKVPTYSFSAYKDGAPVVERSLKTLDELDDLIGKEAARLAKEQFTKAGNVLMEGDSLKVGGEGMKAFYDKMLPSAVNKYVKKWGAKVGVTNIDAPTKSTNSDSALFYAAINFSENKIPYEDAVKGMMAAYPETPENEIRSVLRDSYPKPVHAIEITDKMRDSVMQGQELFQKNRGSIQFPNNGGPSVISLFENADLSTILHESGHFFLEVTADLARQENAPAEIKQDMVTLLDWMGVESWDQVGTEQHEQFARGFEAYLFEGKAPSVELQGVFQRFRSWLVNIYRRLTSLNATPTKEVKQVFDRMLATEEQIKSAEVAAEYKPLFASAEEAGMSPDEWSDYQNTASQATEDALSELQTRSLKNLKWSQNAKSKALRKLQRDTREKRKALEAEVAAEVLDRQIYQTRHFLKKGELPNGRELPEGLTPVKLDAVALAAMYEATRSGTAVDPEIDSLSIAISKLGGLDGIEAEAQGIDPANWRGRAGSSGGNQPIFGKRVFHSTGLSFEAMAEALSQYGYIDADYSANKLVDKLGAELAGNTVYSVQVDHQKVSGPDEFVDWRPLGFGKSGMVAKKEGVHPDLVAERFGFTSGDEMVRRLIDVAPPKEVIEDLTNQRMIERYGDIETEKAIDKAANEAIHNETRLRFVHSELKALNKRVGGVNVLAKAAKAHAEESLARKRVRDIKPAQYSSAEARAGRNAWKSLQSGDMEAAAQHKRAQVLNAHFYRAAKESKNEIDKTVRYLNKFNSANVRKKVDPDYLDQIDSILEKFDLRKAVSLKSIDKRKKLQQWIDEQSEQGLEPVIDDRLLGDIQKRHYKDIPLEALRGLNDSIKNIEHLGRLKNKMMRSADAREMNARINEAVETIEEHSRGKKVIDIETRLPESEAGQFVRGFLASHRKMGSVIRQMDGHKDGGPLWELFMRPLNESGDFEAVEREKATKRLIELFDPLESKADEMKKVVGTLSGGAITSELYQKKYIPEIDRSLSKMGRLMVALNWGNQDNRDRIMDGYGWSPEQVDAILKTLDKRDFDFVQGMWDYINEYWPQIAEKERRLTGVTPKKVEAVPVITRFGELKGGYFPLKYDEKQSPRAYADRAKEAADQSLKGLYSKASTRRGHTKERVRGVKMPVRLDFGVITEHVEQVIHDLAFHEYLVDTHRVMGNHRFQKSVIENHGHEVHALLRDAISDVAAGNIPAQDMVESGVGWLRTGATIAYMGWSVTTAMLQPIGLSQSVTRIGGKWVAKGISRWLTDTAGMENTAQRIYDQSDFMRLRGKTMQREISEIRNRLKKSRAITAVEETYFWFIVKAQLIADIPTWLGGYEKAIHEGNDEKRAIALADQAVIDSQGGGQIKDLARIQRGNQWLRLWTNFYSYFNVTYNRTAESIDKARFKDPLSVGRLASDMLMLYTVPALLATMMYELIRNECDGDLECIAENAAKDQVGYALGVLVGFRELGGLVSGFDYDGPSGSAFIAELGKLYKQAAQGEVDQSLVQTLNKVGGILFHYPASQTQRTANGILAISEGDTENPVRVLTGPEAE